MLWGKCSRVSFSELPFYPFFLFENVTKELPLLLFSLLHHCSMSNLFHPPSSITLPHYSIEFHQHLLLLLLQLLQIRKRRQQRPRLWQAKRLRHQNHLFLIKPSRIFSVSPYFLFLCLCHYYHRLTSSCLCSIKTIYSPRLQRWTSFASWPPT